MAKLSRKKSIGISFLLAQMTLTDDQRQREEILRELIESLGITAEQSAESLQSAARYLRYMASKKRREERQAKPVDASGEPDIRSMGKEELAAYLEFLYARRDELLAERTEPQPATTPDPAPTVEEAPQYDVTAKQRRRLAAFDDMSDDDQIDVLRSLWGAS